MELIIYVHIQGKKSTIMQPDCNPERAGMLKFHWKSRLLSAYIPSTVLILIYYGIIALYVIPRFEFAEQRRFNW